MLLWIWLGFRWLVSSVVIIVLQRWSPWASSGPQRGLSSELHLTLWIEILVECACSLRYIDQISSQVGLIAPGWCPQTCSGWSQSQTAPWPQSLTWAASSCPQRAISLLGYWPWWTWCSTTSPPGKLFANSQFEYSLFVISKTSLWSLWRHSKSLSSHYCPSAVYDCHFEGHSTHHWHPSTAFPYSLAAFPLHHLASSGCRYSLLFQGFVWASWQLLIFGSFVVAPRSAHSAYLQVNAFVFSPTPSDA